MRGVLRLMSGRGSFGRGLPCESYRKASTGPRGWC
jgi:hypothetical protein